MHDVDASHGPGDLSRTLTCEPAAVPSARAALDRWAGLLEPHVFNQGRLLISEVVSGCVIQCGTVDEPITLALSVTSTVLRVDVSHRCAAPVPRASMPEEPSAGWTIYLLGELADRWGVRGREGSSTVWFEVDRG